MDVSEQIEEQTPAATLPGLPPAVLAAPPPVENAPPPAWPVLNRAWLRLAYIFEFWIALLAIFTVWSQVGGQGHLDLIAWYIKLACAVALAWCSIKMTRGMVENARAWNRATVRWFLAVLAISTLIAGITYWYHLHEVPDEPDTDENTATTAGNPTRAPNLPVGLTTRDREHC